MLVADLGLLGQTVPVAIASAVKGDDEVVTRFRLRGNLAQCDTSALERGSINEPSRLAQVSWCDEDGCPRMGTENTIPAHIMGISSQALVFESIKVRLNF